MKTLQVRICKRFKFCNSVSWYWCYMLTLQALTYIGGSQMQTGGPFGTIPQKPWHPKRVRNSVKPVLLSSSLRGSVHLCKLKNSQNSGELLTTERNISLHKDELSLVNLYKTVLPFKYFALVREVSSYFYFECYAFQLLKIYGPSQWG